jgi:hypothetical protein
MIAKRLSCDAPVKQGIEAAGTKYMHRRRRGHVDIQSAIDALNNAVATLQASVAARQTKLDGDNAAIAAAQADAAQQSDQIAADTSAVADIQSAIAQLQALLPPPA